MDVEVFNRVGWNFWLVHGVEKESKGKEEDGEEKEAAVAATYAPKASTVSSRGFRLVPGKVTPIRWWSEAALVGREHDIFWWRISKIVGLHGNYE